MKTIILLLCFITFNVFAAKLLTVGDYIDQTYEETNAADYGLSKDAFFYGVVGHANLKKQGLVGTNDILSIVDFTQTSKNKRFYFFDLAKRVLVHRTYGAHGVNSGDEFATTFSNIPDSKMSSIGLYTTFDESYMGKNGLSIRLNGRDVGYNDKAFDRAIVLHGADYATSTFIEKYGRLGRSWGCPAVPLDEIDSIIDLIVGSTVLFVYSADSDYIKNSVFMDLSVLKESVSIL